MKKDKLILIVTILFIPLLLSGCYSDSKEIDDQVYTLVIGADCGVNNKIRLTVQYPVYKDGGGGEKKESGADGKDEEYGEVDGTIVQTVEASSILEGINILNTSTPRIISLTHTKMLIFSEEFARKGIGNYLEPMARFRETRRIMQVVVCKGKAEDFIKENKASIGNSTSKATEIMSTQSKNNGFFPNIDFNGFYTAILAPYGQGYTAYGGVNDFKAFAEGDSEDNPPLRTIYDIELGEVPRKGGTKREFIGTAIFDGDRMVGSLNSYETRYFMMVIGEFERGIITIEDKNKKDAAIPLDVRLGRKPRISARFEDGVPKIDVNLNIECDIGAIQSRIQYEELDKLEDLNSYIEEIFEDGIRETIEKTQEVYGVDIFSFGKQVAKHFFTIQEFEDYNWLEHYKNADINVNVDVNVRRTGLMAGSKPIRYKDKKRISEVGK